MKSNKPQRIISAEAKEALYGSVCCNVIATQKDKTMTRKEEIAQAFREIDRKYHYDALAPACLDMAEWADKTMIEKVCRWLEDHIDKDLIIYLSYTWLRRDEFINELRKAMEE